MEQGPTPRRPGGLAVERVDANLSVPATLARKGHPKCRAMIPECPASPALELATPTGIPVTRLGKAWNVDEEAASFAVAASL